MPCRTEYPDQRAERLRVEALKAAIELSGWAHTATEPEVVIDIARDFYAYLAGEGEDGGDE